MKKLVLVLSAVLFLLPRVAVANLPLEQRPSLAVYVSGHSDHNVNRILGIDLMRELVQSELYRDAPRLEEFLESINAESQIQTVAENRIIEIARELDIQRVCIISMEFVLDSYYITAKIINTENGRTLANGNIGNPLVVLADIKDATERIIGVMFSTPTQRALPTMPQTQQHMPTARERQIMAERMQQESIFAPPPRGQMQYQNFTVGERVGTWALNSLVAGLGSFIIMDDDFGGGVQIGLTLISITTTITYVASEGEEPFMLVIGAACLLTNTVFNIVRSATYDRVTPKVSSTEDRKFDFALFPNQNGNLTAYARYSLEF